MQNNCNPLIPWKTFLMRKIWRFSAPSKRNLGLVVPGADVAVPGLCLSDHWAFWTPGTLAAAAAAPLGEGGDRRGWRMESSDEEGWVWGVFTGQKCELCTDLCSSCLASVKRCHLIPSSPTDPNLPMCPHAQASPMRAHSWGWLPCHFPVGMWVPASSRNKAPEKSKCYKKMQNLIWKSLSHCSMTIQYCMWYHSICVYWSVLNAGSERNSRPFSTRNL